MRAGLDSQHTTDGNRRHWQHADGTAVDAMANPAARKILRQRNRYEYHNNCYYFGIAHTLADYIVGCGPRLQMLLADKEANAAIELAVWQWSRAVRLGSKLRSSRLARIYNGEGFTVMRSNPTLAHSVKLDLIEIEADQVASPTFPLNANPLEYYFDGVILDGYGRPTAYHILKQHPGSLYPIVALATQYDTVDARFVLHDFKPTRPGQVRGIPEFTPGLEPIARLRKYGIAVVGTATAAALPKMVFKSDLPPDADSPDINPMEILDLPEEGGLTLPAGMDAVQIRAEQPTTMYDAFVKAQLQEISRCLGVPLMIASLDAAQANMSSAYVVMQPFAQMVKIERDMIYEPMLDRVLEEFIAEARLVPGLLPEGLPDYLPHTWQWPKVSNHADPAKIAAANGANLAIGSTSIPQICAENGDDWEEVQEQNAKSLGMTLDEYRSALRQRIFAIPGTPAPETVPPEAQPQGQPAGNKPPGNSAD